MLYELIVVKTTVCQLID